MANAQLALMDVILTLVWNKVFVQSMFMNNCSKEHFSSCTFLQTLKCRISRSTLLINQDILGLERFPSPHF